MTKLLCKSGRELKNAGAEALVLCANIAHKSADALENDSGLPVLHIVDFTAKKLVDGGFRKVGLLATRAVMEQEFYKARLKDRYGLEVFVPDEAFRAKVDGLVFDELNKEIISEAVKSSFHTAYDRLLEDHQVDCVILGCTELRLVFNTEQPAVPTFETTKLHARGIADWALSDKESPN